MTWNEMKQRAKYNKVSVPQSYQVTGSYFES